MTLDLHRHDLDRVLAKIIPRPSPRASRLSTQHLRTVH